MAEAIAALSVAAGALQLADLGARLSVRLFTVSKQVKNATTTYSAISQEVSFTSSVLKQLHDTLQDGGQQKAHNQKSLVVLQDLTKDCKEIFCDIESMVTFCAKPGANSTSKTFSQWRHRLSLPYKEKTIAEHQCKLERVKSLLSLMLHMLSLAAQVKNSQNGVHVKDLLLEQREMLKNLMQTLRGGKDGVLTDIISLFQQPGTQAQPANTTQELALYMPPGIYVNGKLIPPATRTANIDKVSKPRVSAAPLPRGNQARLRRQENDKFVPSPEKHTVKATTSECHSVPSTESSSSSSGSSSSTISSKSKDIGPFAFETQHKAFREHARLTAALLSVVNNRSFGLKPRMRYLMHDGILSLHYDINDDLRAKHTVPKLVTLLEGCPDLAEYWTEEHERELLRETDSTAKAPTYRAARAFDEAAEAAVKAAKGGYGEHEEKSAEEAAKEAARAAEKAAIEAEEKARVEAEEEHKKKIEEFEEATKEAKGEAEALEAKAVANAPVKKKAPLRFKDALGRNYNFPWDRCNRWDDMEGLIHQAFAHIDRIGPHVIQGCYDLVGPDKAIIMPDYWEDAIEPGMAISMMLWPIPESELEPSSGKPEPGSAFESIPPPVNDDIIDLDALLGDGDRPDPLWSDHAYESDGLIDVIRDEESKSYVRSNTRAPRPGRTPAQPNDPDVARCSARLPSPSKHESKDNRYRRFSPEEHDAPRSSSVESHSDRRRQFHSPELYHSRPKLSVSGTAQKHHSKVPLLYESIPPRSESVPEASLPGADPVAYYKDKDIHARSYIPQPIRQLEEHIRKAPRRSRISQSEMRQPKAYERERPTSPDDPYTSSTDDTYHPRAAQVYSRPQSGQEHERFFARRPTLPRCASPPERRDQNLLPVQPLLSMTAEGAEELFRRNFPNGIESSGEEPDAKQEKEAGQTTPEHCNDIQDSDVNEFLSMFTSLTKDELRTLDEL